MKTRAVLAMTALVASGATAASASPVHLTVPRCPSFADAAKDDKNADTGTGEDPALDILKVTESVAGNTYTATLTLAGPGAPTYAEGAQYFAGFHVGGKSVSVFGTRSLTLAATDTAFAMKGIEVDGTFVSGTESLVTFTEGPAANTVTLSTSLSSLSTAVGKRVNGMTATGLFAEVDGTYVVVVEPYDEALAPASAKLALAPCR